ncbi:MAG: hypothetical protein J6B10_00845 [Lachnospiraceae bacterium]|nr:hypothetical protein [Lachnospiraceae bacterium]
MKYGWIRGMKRILAVSLAVAMTFVAVPPVETEAIGAESAIAVGIDVSKYQGNVNWGAVAAQGITFSFVKVGSAKSGLDPYFDANMRGSTAAGLRTGVYIYSYATSVEAAVAEANWVLSVIDPYPVSFPVVFDIEDAIHKNLDPGTLSLMSNAFCMVIEEAGYYPMVYSGRNFFRDRLPGVVYDRWVAQYNSSLEYDGASIWQATSKGALAGINGNVDMNYLFKDYSGLIIPYGWLPRKGSYYFYENWKLKKGWIDYNGAKYYSDPSGRMVTGWQKLDEGGVRYFRPDGIMSVGFNNIAEKYYYFDPNGYMQTGMQDIGGFKFLFGADGVMHTGWHNDGAHIRYFMANGAMATSLQKIGDAYYYFDADGYMQTGFTPINGYTFYFDATGVLQKGWISDGTYRYYFNPANGAMTTGIANIDGQIYSFDEKGHMQTGFIAVNGQTFYFSPADGTLQKGWLTVGSNRYYLTANGAMATNWQLIDGSYYHFDQKSGVMTTYNWVDAGNGQKFFVGLDGRMMTGWQQIGGSVYYFGENGLLVTNTQMVVNGVLYQLDATGAATALGAVQ